MRRFLTTMLSTAMLALWSVSVTVQAQPVTGTRVVPITPTAKWSRAFSSMSTYTTALVSSATKSAAAEVLTTGPANSATGTTGRCVIDRPGGNIVAVVLYGVGTENQTVNLQVWAWDQLVVGSTSQWVPTLLWDGQALLSTIPGIAGGLVDETMYYADTFTTTSDAGLSPLGTRVMSHSTANKGIAVLVIDPLTASKIEIEAEVGTATSYNLLYKIGG